MCPPFGEMYAEMDVAKTVSFVDRLRGMSAPNRIWLARGAAEVVGIVAGTVGSVVVGDVLLRQPYGSVKEWVGQHVVLPHLDAFEHWMMKFPSIDPEEDRMARSALPDAERARLLGNKVMDIFGLPMVMGMVGQFATQTYGIRALGLSGQISKWENRMAFAADKAAVAVTIGALNFGFPKQSEAMQDSIENTFKRMGLPQESADSLSSLLVNWQLPNVAGFLAAVGVLNWARKH